MHFFALWCTVRWPKCGDFWWEMSNWPFFIILFEPFGVVNFMASHVTTLCDSCYLNNLLIVHLFMYSFSFTPVVWVGFLKRLVSIGKSYQSSVSWAWTVSESAVIYLFFFTPNSCHISKSRKESLTLILAFTLLHSSMFCYLILLHLCRVCLFSAFRLITQALLWTILKEACKRRG